MLLTGLLVALVPLSLWLLGVRDWRCYVVALLWISVFNAVQTANVTLPILAGAAVCWRYRDRWRWPAIAGGLAVAAKIVAWPLLVWLAATGRARAALGAVGVAVGVTVGLWATIGFSGLRSYPDSVDNLADQGERGYTLQALALDAGLRAVGVLVSLPASGSSCRGCRLTDVAATTVRSFAWATMAMIVVAR